MEEVKTLNIEERDNNAIGLLASNRPYSTITFLRNHHDVSCFALAGADVDGGLALNLANNIHAMYETINQLANKFNVALMSIMNAIETLEERARNYLELTDKGNVLVQNTQHYSSVVYEIIKSFIPPCCLR